MFGNLTCLPVPPLLTILLYYSYSHIVGPFFFNSSSLSSQMNTDAIDSK